MTSIVLDASALLALTRRERGADRVTELLSDSVISTVNFSEAAGYYARSGVAEAQIRALFDILRIERIPFDEELAYIAGLMLPKTRSAGLSFGDRACLALAFRINGRALTADRAWSRIAEDVGVEVEVIR